MTVRSFLQKELEKRAVKVETERSYTTPIGRLVPDLLLRNGAQYVVETKLGAEAKLLDAMVRLHDYSKYTDAKGAFAILFPEELRRPWPVEMLEKIAIDPKLKYIAIAIFKDFRPSSRYEGNLSEVADWIASQVLRALAVEADTGFAIKVLTQAVDSITLSVKSLKGEDLEEIFGGKTVFENILQYEEGHYPLDEMRQAATYLLVNQIIFYHILSTANPQFETIDESKIGKPVDLLRYFEAVLKKDYTSVFGFDVASKLPQSATEVIKRVIVVVKALAPEKIGHDVLGKVFHELIPFNIRKAVAAFYTNNEAAEILAGLAIERSDAKVIDLACGSGTLLVAAYRKKKELLHCGSSGISLEDHRRFLEKDLTGVDIMPFAAHLAVMHLSLQALLHETEKVRVAVWDSTELKPNMNILAVYSELKAAYRKPTLDMFKEKFVIPKDAYMKKGAVTLEGVGGEEIPLEKVDLVIMNPPFTRQERLPKEYKESLARRFSDYSKYAHGQLGLYGYFLFLADRFVKEEGRIAFVLPATVLRVQSARGVRKLLTDRYAIEHIITAWERAAFSEGAQFREILLIARKGKPKADSECCISSFERLPSSMEEANRYVQKLKTVVKRSKLGEPYADDDINAVKVTQAELKKHVDNLYVFISTYDLELPSLHEKILTMGSERLALFESLLKRQKGSIFEFDYRPPFHGVFVVEPFRAIKNVDEWIIKSIDNANTVVENRFTKQTLKAPLKAFARGLRRSARTDKIEVTDILDLIITKQFSGIETVMKHPANIKKWSKYVEPRLANLVVSRRFDISATGTRFLAYYSEEPIVGVDMWSIKGLSDDDAKILSLWFNSTLNLIALIIQRTETRGAWMKLHEYAMKEMQLLDPKKLKKQEREQLLQFFDSVKATQFPSILEQLRTQYAPRKELDIILLRLMGYSDKEALQLLDYLYPALANEIEKLKTLMEG
jgi:type I restriction-modification system DNA methylase subunit